MLQLNWFNYKFVKQDGYGRYGMHLVRALARVGVSVYPGVVSQLEMPGDLLRMAGHDFSRLTVALMPPHELRGIPGRLVNYTMYECNRLRCGWIDQINGLCERVIVPAPWLVDVLESHNCEVPIHVIPGGIDPHEFRYVRRNGHRPYTFLALGDRGSRKGWDLVWSAFYEAFGNSQDVRLVIKSRHGGPKWGEGRNAVTLDLSNSDPRLSVWAQDVDDMAHVYAQADCFVFPTRAEGWGLPPREGAATGLPVIAPRHSGTAVGVDHWALPLEKYTLRNALIEAQPFDDGTPPGWWVCDVDEIAAQMRWCYDHQDAARQKGLEAAQWLRENQTWDHSAHQLIALLDGSD